MLNWIKKKIRWFLALLIIPAAFAATSLDIEKKPVIEEAYKLKSDKEKILDSKEIDWIEDVLDEDGMPTGEIINKGKIRKYDYISDVEVATATIKIKDGKREKTIIEKVEKRTGNARFFETGKVIDGKKEIVGQFYSGTPFIKQNDKWYHTETATTTVEAYYEQTKDTLKDKISRLFLKNVIATDYYTSAGDGRTGGRDVVASWSNIRNGTGITDDLTTYTGVGNTTPYSSTYSSGYYNLRSHFPIDTSGLPDTAIITAAILKLYISKKSGDADGVSYVVVNQNQANTTSLTLSDYTTFTFTNAASIDYDSLTASQYNSWTLNSTGRGWISKTGYTKLGMVTSIDMDDSSPPTGVNRIQISFSEQTGTSQDPYIAITYTEAAAYLSPPNININWD